MKTKNPDEIASDNFAKIFQYCSFRNEWSLIKAKSDKDKFYLSRHSHLTHFLNTVAYRIVSSLLIV